MTTFFEALNDLQATHEPFVAVTVVDTLGSTPQERGSKMLVTKDGRRFGTVGGGKIEVRAIAEAQQLLMDHQAPKTRFFQWQLNKDIGMTCGGVVRVYFEAFNVTRWNVVVFGAGHVANALVELLVKLDCRIICIDPREEWLAKLVDSPKLTRVHSTHMPDEVAKIADGSYVVLMSMGHTTDKPVLLEILRTRSFPYLGVIGSNAKRKRLEQDIVEAGLPEELTKAFRCPVGLPFGSDAPWEIAVSVVAEMMQVRDAHAAHSAHV